MDIKYLCLIALSAMISSCHNHSEGEESHHHDDEEDNPFAVHFSDEMQAKVDFSIAKVEKMNIGTIIETVAQVQSAQNDETVICAKADGVVTTCNSNLTAGSPISSGQTICTINASATANNNLSSQQQQAKAEHQRAKAEYERLVELRNNRLALESDVINAKAAMDAAAAQMKALQTGFAGGSQTVAAPNGGFLKQLLVKNGQFVQAGTEIAVITKSQTLQLKAEVPASYYPQLKSISDANIRIQEGETMSLKSLGGKLLSYGHQTSTDSPLIPVTFEVKNIVDIVPGTFVDMFIKTTSNDERLCVPSTAILEEMGNWFVYVQTSKEHFEKRLVKIGATDGINTEIRSGLTDSDKVVARGAMLVKLQQAAGGVDAEAGHHH